MRRSRVLIVDDHVIFRSGLRDLLQRSFDVIDEAREGGEAVEKAVTMKPDVVVMDVSMPGMGGIEAARQIREHLPETGVVIMSATDEDQQVFDAIQAGVSGYVVKDDDPSSVVHAVQNAAEGKAYLPPLVAKRVLEGVASASWTGKQDRLGNTSTPLSSRELAVLRLLAQGKRNREIADDLCISERTVGNHITSIYNKLCIYDRAQAIVYAIKKGIIRV